MPFLTEEVFQEVLERLDLTSNKLIKLETKLDKLLAVYRAAYYYRKAEQNSTPRLFRGKHLQDLANILDFELEAMGRSQEVRQRILIPRFGGSNPPAPATTQEGE